MRKRKRVDIIEIEQITPKMLRAYCRACEADQHRGPDGHWHGTEPGWHEKWGDAFEEMMLALGLRPWELDPIYPQGDPKAIRLQRLLEAARAARRRNGRAKHAR